MFLVFCKIPFVPRQGWSQSQLEQVVMLESQSYASVFLKKTNSCTAFKNPEAYCNTPQVFEDFENVFFRSAVIPFK